MSTGLLGPELPGHEGCALSAFLRTLPAPGRPQHGAPSGCRTRRPYRGRGGAVVGSGSGNPGSPAGRGAAELPKDLPEAERGNGHPMGPERPGTLALPNPSGGSGPLRV